MIRRIPIRAAVLLALPLLLALAACGEDSAAREATPPSVPGGATWVNDPFSGGYPTYDDGATGLRIVFGTPDLGPGPSRVSFALFDDVGLISFPTLTVASRFYPEGPEGDFHAVEEEDLVFRPFPGDSRGIYTGTLDFHTAGLWALDVAVPQPDGEFAHVLFPVQVAEEAEAPAVGERAPASASRTSADQPDLYELTTSRTPDPRLYETSIATALERGVPFVLTFASPAFCTNALCGPQVEVLSELADAHGDAAAYIHVDLYENPREIQGDFTLARRSPVLREWGIHTDEWTFVVDTDGIVAARFEGFAPREEVEAALLDVIQGQ